MASFADDLDDEAYWRQIEREEAQIEIDAARADRAFDDAHKETKA